MIGLVAGLGVAMCSTPFGINEGITAPDSTTWPT